MSPSKPDVELLEKERRETQEELERLRGYLAIEVEGADDEVDLDVYEREKTLSLIQNLELKLQEVDNAITLAHKGTYGICERCGKPIDPARLEALPEASLCFVCKVELERLARR
ncbi:MAG: hypothetical protein EXR62_14890 [Chloroflexi bacterium]|nr:hypothetical protein [Chloroflexota bacterium]